jgi:hypothetical protein
MKHTILRWCHISEFQIRIHEMKRILYLTNAVGDETYCPCTNPGFAEELSIGCEFGNGIHFNAASGCLHCGFSHTAVSVLPQAIIMEKNN